MTNLKDRLEELLRQPARTPADADRAAQAAEALAAYLRLEERALFLLGETDVHVERTTKTGGDSRFKGTSLHRAAEEVLREAGLPLHVRELGKRIKAGGWTHTRSRNASPDQILYQLAARLPRYPEVFERVAPNTFALKEWDRVRNDRPRPRLGLFSGAGKPPAREIDDRAPEAAASGQWRSS